MTEAYRRITRCRVCGNSALVSVLSLGQQALTGVFPRGPAEPVAVGPLELVKCMESAHGCGLLQLAHTFAFDQLYGMNYGYRSGLNAGMVQHLNRKVDRIRELINLRQGDVVLDIGSNDGTLLAAYPSELTRIGMDPTGVKFRKFYPQPSILIEDFFSAKRFNNAIGSRAKVVTSIAMFYDLEEPVAFADDVREVLADDGVWIFEQSYLPTMLSRLAYDTIAHEHLEFYSLRQAHWILDKAGFKIIDVELNDVNGGSFSITAAKRESHYPEATTRVQQLIGFEIDAELSSLSTYMRFGVRVQDHRAALRTFVHDAHITGRRVFGYGASTKGNVVLQYCGFTARDIEAIAEVNEDKFGRFTPGSKIPIISEEEMRKAAPDYLLVLPWHFRAGFLRRERAYLKGGGRLVFALPQLEILGLS